MSVNVSGGPEPAPNGRINCPSCGAELEITKLNVVQILSPGQAERARVLRIGLMCSVEECCQPIWATP